MTSTIPVDEYAARRERVLNSLGDAAAVVFAGEGSAPLLGKWYANKHFVWLTGIVDEPGAAVVFDPSAPDPGEANHLASAPAQPRGRGLGRLPRSDWRAL